MGLSAHSHTYRQFTVTNQIYEHDFGLWEEAREPRENT